MKISIFMFVFLYLWIYNLEKINQAVIPKFLVTWALLKSTHFHYSTLLEYLKKMVTVLYSRYFFYLITLLYLSNEISLFCPTLNISHDWCVNIQEFYQPMRATSLLTLDQLDTIFMNLDELMHVHRQLMDRLTHALTEAQQQGDQVRQWNTWWI